MMGTKVGHVVIEADGGVVRATIDRPEVKNAIDDGVIQGLEAVVEQAELERARVLVLRGAGGTFCAGADLRHILSLIDDRTALEGYVTRLSDVLERLERAPFASVCVIEGYALAGGCEILLACDISLAADDARIGDRHIEYGLLPGAAGSVRLSRALPPARSRYLLLAGEMISGREAAEWGLATRAVPANELDAEVERLVAGLASRGSDALAAMKQMTVGVRNLTFGEAVRVERRLFLDHLQNSPEAREGLAAFREHRAPRFGGGSERPGPTTRPASSKEEGRP